jgi:hypothetical protein
VTARRLLALGAAGALALAGCGGGDAKSGPSAAALAAPATGPKMTGPGYELHLTGAWRRHHDTAEAILGGEFATNGPGDMNVVRTKLAPGDDPAKRLREFNREELSTYDPSSSTAPRLIDLDGSAGTSFEYRSSDSPNARGRFVNVVHGGYVYSIGFEADVAKSPSARSEFAAMLSSWRWT